MARTRSLTFHGAKLSIEPSETGTIYLETHGWRNQHIFGERRFTLRGQASWTGGQPQVNVHVSFCGGQGNITQDDVKSELTEALIRWEAKTGAMREWADERILSAQHRLQTAQERYDQAQISDDDLAEAAAAARAARPELDQVRDQLDQLQRRMDELLEIVDKPGQLRHTRAQAEQFARDLTRAKSRLSGLIAQRDKALPQAAPAAVEAPQLVAAGLGLAELD